MPLMTARCIAPPLTLEDLERIEAALPADECGGIMRRLVRLARRAKHAGGIPDGLPSAETLNQWGRTLDRLQEPHRTPAFNLLWHVTEFRCGRYPVEAEQQAAIDAVKIRRAAG
jgi:hypothetical protein